MAVRIRIEGKYIETQSDFELQLTKENNLYTFGDIENARTVSFSIPATATNNSILQHANSIDIVLSTTAFVMNYNSAIIEGDGINIEGVLYITECDAESYKCVFTFGEFSKFTDIKKKGNLANFYCPPVAVVIGDSDAANNNPIFGIYKYGNKVEGETTPRPSIGILDYLNELKYRGVKIDTSGIEESWRLVISTPIKSDYWFSGCTMYANGTSDPKVNEDVTVLGQKDIGGSIQGATISKDTSVGYYATLGKVVDSNGDSVYNMYGTYTLMSYNKQIELVFPDDTPNDLCIVSDFDWNNTKFIGTRKYNTTTGQLTGTTLAGAKLVIPQNMSFTLYRFNTETVVRNKPITIDGEQCYQSYFAFSKMSVSIYIENLLVRKSTQSYSYINLSENLPKITLVQLYTAMAMLSGSLVRVTDQGQLGLKKITANQKYDNIVDVSDNVINIESLQRNFKDFAQHNYVRFQSGKSVPKEQQLMRDYPIPYTILETEKDLYVAPFSEGGYSEFEKGVYGLTIVDGDVVTLGVWDSDNNTLQQKFINNNPLISSIVKNPLTFVVKVRMPLYQYESITETTALFVRDIICIWTSSQWSNGVATFSLQRIS